MKRASKWLMMLGLFSLVATGCKKEQTPADLARKEGNKLFKEKKYSEAAAAFKKSLELDPTQATLWEKMAVAHQEAAEWDAFDSAMIKVAEFKPDNVTKAEVYRNVAGFYVNRGDSEKAEKFFVEATSLDPKDALSYAWLGEIFAQRGGAKGNAPVNAMNLEKAMEYYDRAIAATPDEPNTYVNKRVVVLKYMTHLKKEIELLEQQAASQKDKTIKAELTVSIDDTKKRVSDFEAMSTTLLAQYKEKAAAKKAAQ